MVKKEKKILPKHRKEVYCFKAFFRYRPNLWRRIEIQGKQTLAVFDSILRDAFQHDTGDHLSGFWKRIKQDTSQCPRGDDDGHRLMMARDLRKQFPWARLHSLDYPVRLDALGERSSTL